ncbi:serine hydrolase domain-containing protein [Thalassobacillus pellis]|uniref:serine hydrolase domain-containing protein n=1 Tax=Thalassobacillus pellis TaxID=748008 RepID=UPI00196091C6|nr:serine hydrolase domain-containing protein [Thalassobacillus pellis]MBM7554589.1 CubicO group peptidase (beta-lactamase class C family)/uncharacterized integral membrane protein [Thalassobacillus pellis]
MRYILLLIVLCLIATPIHAQETMSQRDRLKTFMEKGLETYHIPGASLAVVQDGKVVFQQSYGKQSNGQLVTNDTLFPLGSISKPLTSLGILKLAEKGRLDLDSPMDRYLDLEYGQAQMEERITIRHLLAHTSGISTYAGLKVAEKKLRGEDAITQAVQMLNPVKLSTKPGDIHQYSAANYLILGRIIEKVTGDTYAEYMQQAIFSPLHMKQTVATYEAAKRQGYQPGFQSWFGRPVKSENWVDDSGAPYGYITSNSNDVVQYMKAVLNRNSLLTEPFSSMYVSPEIHRKGDTYYGLGWRMDWKPEEKILFHGGETPDSRSELVVNLSKDYAYILLTNKSNFSEVMHAIYLKEGIRTILETEEMPDLPPPAFQRKWYLVLAIAVTAAWTIWNLFRLRKKKRRMPKRWMAIAVGMMLFGLLLIPLMVSFFKTPWHTIVAYAPDLAFFLQALAGVLLIHGIGILGVQRWKAKKHPLPSQQG